MIVEDEFDGVKLLGKLGARVSRGNVIKKFKCLSYDFLALGPDPQVSSTVLPSIQMICLYQKLVSKEYITRARINKHNAHFVDQHIQYGELIGNIDELVQPLENLIVQIIGKVKLILVIGCSNLNGNIIPRLTLGCETIVSPMYMRLKLLRK